MISLGKIWWKVVFINYNDAELASVW